MLAGARRSGSNHGHHMDHVCAGAFCALHVHTRPLRSRALTPAPSTLYSCRQRTEDGTSTIKMTRRGSRALAVGAVTVIVIAPY